MQTHQGETSRDLTPARCASAIARRLKFRRNYPEDTVTDPAGPSTDSSEEWSLRSRSILIALASFIGIVDALYLTLKRNAGPVPCHVTRGCTDVLTSQYSAVLGVPISAFGLIFYLVVFSLAVFQISAAGKTLDWVFWLASAALAISAVLVGIQAFALKAYCEYCLLSAILVLTIFLLSARPWAHKHPQ
jgi:uncharacterized membrane protein